MKNLLFLFILSGLFLSGCTYNVSKYSSANNDVFFARLNTEIDDRNASVETKDSVFTAGSIKAGNDSLKAAIARPRYYAHYMEFLNPQHISMPNDEIKIVSFIKRTDSILKGIALGAAAGGFLGMYLLPPVGGASNSGDHSIPPSLLFFAGSLPGMLAGCILGAIVGDEYIFNYENEPGPLSRNPLHRFGIKTGYITDFTTRYIETEGYWAGNTKLASTSVPGYSVSLYYNFHLNKMFSVNNELSLISSGDEQTYSIIKYKDYKPISSNSKERLTLLELAPQIRLNLRRTVIIPYIFMGPKVDFLVSSSKAKVNFYDEMNRIYGNSFYTTSGKYSKIVYGGSAGLGISTGRMLPWEISAEIKYNFDVSERFTIDNHFARSNYYYNPEVYQNSSSWTFNLGFAFD